MRSTILWFALAVCPAAFCASDSAEAKTAPAMEVRYYPCQTARMHKHYTPGRFCEKPLELQAKEEERGWQAFFTPFGVKWPEGSTVALIGTLGKLRVRNTPENLDKIASAMAEIERETNRPQLIEIEVRMISVGQKALDEIGPKLAAKKTAGARYDLDDFSGTDAAALERALVARPDVGGGQPWKLVTRIGAEAVVKRVTEYSYPTDFDVQLSGPTNGHHFAAVEPQHFMLREAGTTIVLTPESSEEEDKAITVRFTADIVDDPTWRNYGMTFPAPNGTTYELPMEQPIFSVRSFDTTLTLMPGRTVLANASSGNGKDGQDANLLIFVRAKPLKNASSK